MPVHAIAISTYLATLRDTDVIAQCHWHRLPVISVTVITTTRGYVM